MIVTATNARDSLTYSASVVERRKTVFAHYKIKNTESEWALAWLTNEIQNQPLLTRYEAAVWQGTLGVLKCLTAPRLIVYLALGLKYISQAEFRDVLREILTDGDLSDVEGDSELSRRLESLGFFVFPVLARSVLMRRPIQAVCMTEFDPKEMIEDFGVDPATWGTDDEPQSGSPSEKNPPSP